MHEQPDEKLMIRYLLSDLPEDEQLRLEQLYFTNDDVFELLLATEDELMERYALGKLSPRETKLFKTKYLHNPHMREKVELASSFVRSFPEITGMATKPRPTSLQAVFLWWKSLIEEVQDMRPLPKFGLALSFLLAIAGVWLTFRLGALHRDLQSIESERLALKQKEERLQQELAVERASKNNVVGQLDAERKQRVNLEGQLAKTSQASRSMLSFVLSPGALRDLGEPQNLFLPHVSGLITLQLDIEGEKEYTSYRVTIQTVDNRVVWSEDGLKKRSVDGGKTVSIILDSEVLSSGDYRLTLFGRSKSNALETVGQYYFSVERQSK